MKTRFNTADIRAVIQELNLKFLGLRVANCYDIDSKTYLIKLAKPDLKAMILLESGNRIHSTEFDWPKNMSPSGFAMKLRKHLRGRRLEKVEQLGVDRIVDLQFGSGEAAYHIILELYDRGNIVLTDHEYLILNILRPRTDGSEDVKFAVRETYPISLAKQAEGPISIERLNDLLSSAKEGDNLKKILIPNLAYGPAIIEHCLGNKALSASAKVGINFNIAEDSAKLLSALHEADQIFTDIGMKPCKGYITQKREKKAVVQDGESSELLTYNEFHPYLWRQLEKEPYLEFDTFDKAVDEFFSKLEGQKLDMKVLHQEKAALKKLENVRKDHEKRLTELQREQDADKLKASLIEMNLELVDRAILVIQSALANQIDWSEIENLVKEAQLQGDPIAGSIKALKLHTNHITLLLKDPFDYLNSDDDEEDRIKPMKIDIDLGLSAYANARKYYDMKRHAAVKEQKTIDASTKALKSAEKKTKETLKDVAITASINKTRKAYWFEKFLWFISSENYLVIGGRDQQQNELVVKRYLRPGDLYVHADLHGASSVVIKNPGGEPVPPKTLTEAGTMAVCYSAAWDAKVVTSAWWVNHDQVSKTAPTGEYLTTGSFMIRGKKNYLPPCYLIYGFGFMYKLDEDSIERHAGERRVRAAEEDTMSAADSTTTESEGNELIIEEDDEENDDDEKSENEDTLQNDEKSQSGDEEPENKNKQLQTDTGVTAEAVCDKKENVKDEETASESEDEESMFPDTAINLQHVKGDKFVPQRNVSRVSQSSEGDNENAEPDTASEAGSQDVKSGGKLTAKQRREMRKARKNKELGSEGGEIKTERDQSDTVQQQGGSVNENSPRPLSQQKSQEPPKRGQKGKLKKMKEKYKDQDEEERQLKMEILASSGAAKEKLKKGKNKQKQKQQQQKQLGQGPPQKGQGQQQKGQGQKVGPRGPLTLEDIMVKPETLAAEAPRDSKVDPQADDPGNESDDGKQPEDESAKITEDLVILNSLTGQPVIEDTLLYTIPVCAPYSCMVNYKYKVKLTPGTTKRGKAAKMAHNMFLHDKTLTPREKELLRVVKDTDLSRNMPGKVKVSAPNLQKAKSKKK